MNKYNLKVEYIYHSCFSIENENYQLIFDYYKGDLKLNRDKKIIFFATHNHEDHFNREILNMAGDYYILSGDIGLGSDYKDNIIFLNPYEEVKVEDLKIRTFGSTDAGLSFLVNLDGVNIFHAGDLNWWHWENDTESEKAQMEKDFKGEVDLISKFPVDLVFAPVDPRLEEYYFIAAKHFIEKLKPQVFFPMHFGDNYSKNQAFIHNMKDYPVDIVNITRKNQVFEI